MCGETRIPSDMCAGNTHPWETHIPVTALAAGDANATTPVQIMLSFRVILYQ